jgi:hypothetical protein
MDSQEHQTQSSSRVARNWNVVLGISVAAVAGLSESVWSSTVLSAFIYLLTGGSNLSVGYAEGDRTRGGNFSIGQEMNPSVDAE